MNSCKFVDQKKVVTSCYPVVLSCFLIPPATRHNKCPRATSGTWAFVNAVGYTGLEAVARADAEHCLVNAREVEPRQRDEGLAVEKKSHGVVAVALNKVYLGLCRLLDHLGGGGGAVGMPSSLRLSNLRPILLGGKHADYLRLTQNT